MEQRWVAIGIAVAMVAVSLPAQADFHQDCTGLVTAYANTGLSYDPAEEALSYQGVVSCPDTTVDIHDVSVGPADDDALASTANEGCQAELAAPCTASDTLADPGEGVYDVSMRFSTPGFPNVERLQRFLWTGDGQPVPVCVHVGFFPVSAGDCPGGPVG